MRQHAVYWIAILLCTGCSAIPDVVHEPQYHNPFPQISRVAVLPFFNQSADPTIDQERIALAYYNELQQIPGFEVVPVGVAKRMLVASGIEAKLNEGGVSGEDFQRLAQSMGVDAVVVGSVTEYTPYYPPRLGLSVRWYAANPGFHPIPPGYGLPWGTSQEKHIPEPFVFEAEFALAQEQLKTQTPRTVRLLRSRLLQSVERRHASQPGSSGTDHAGAPPAAVPLREDARNRSIRSLRRRWNLRSNPDRKGTCPRIGPTRGGSCRRRPARRGPPLRPNRSRSCGTRSSTKATIRISRDVWPTTTISATKLGSAAGRATCSAAKTSFASVAICTSRKCWPPAAVPAKRE